MWEVVSSISLLEKQNKMLFIAYFSKNAQLIICFLADLPPCSYWKTICNYMPLMKKCAQASAVVLPHPSSPAAVWSRVWCLFPRSLGRCKTASFQSWQDMASPFIFNYRSSVSFNFDFLGSSLYTLQIFLSKFQIYIYPVFKLLIWAKNICGF